MNAPAPRDAGPRSDPDLARHRDPPAPPAKRARWSRFVDELAMGARFLAGLRPFLRERLTAAECDAMLGRSLATREERFLELMRRGVFERTESPYAPLFQRAGLDYGGLERWVREHGLEGALGRLCDAGVRVTLDEFKGRVPILRDGSGSATARGSFDNPLLTRHYETQSSGSRGPATRLIIDLELLAHEAAYESVFLRSFGLADRPKVLWHPAPPGSAGLKLVLRLMRLGHPVERWFSQTPVSFRDDRRHAAFVHAMHAASRFYGRPIVRPEHVRLDDAAVVAEWLASCVARGTPAFLSATTSSAVRACRAAVERGLDIRGTFIRASGEPLTPGKVRAIEAAGCRVHCHYAMAEVSRIAIACASPSHADDVHVALDKVALLQREIALPGGARVAALMLTTLHWSVPKVMINVELGDYGVLERRSCGCPWDGLGYVQHLHSIRSYEKLVTEGMHFMGADLTLLADEILPARFGGSTTDYQFVEEESEGLTRVLLRVSPRVGTVDERAIEALVLEVLGGRDAAHRMMAGVWGDGGTLRVVRREPHATRTGKVHVLHVEGGGDTGE